MIVTVQRTPDSPDGSVKKCPLTAVSSAFSPCYQKNHNGTK